MAKLLNIDVPDIEKTKAQSKIQAVPVPGDVVTRFNEARDQLDRAAAVITELKPELHESGMRAVFEHNCQNADDSKARVSSVNLLDEETGEMVQFTWSKKNLKNDPKQVESELNRLRTQRGQRLNVNDYVGYEVVADFDEKVFMVDGRFSKERRDAIMAALDAVSLGLGIKNPLKLSKMLKPKPDFHDRRWEDFDVETNLVIQAVLPTQVSLEPIRPEENE